MELRLIKLDSNLQIIDTVFQHDWARKDLWIDQNTNVMHAMMLDVGNEDSIYFTDIRIDSMGQIIDTISLDLNSFSKPGYGISNLSFQPANRGLCLLKLDYWNEANFAQDFSRILQLSSGLDVILNTLEFSQASRNCPSQITPSGNLLEAQNQHIVQHSDGSYYFALNFQIYSSLTGVFHEFRPVIQKRDSLFNLLWQVCFEEGTGYTGFYAEDILLANDSTLLIPGKAEQATGEQGHFRLVILDTAGTHPDKQLSKNQLDNPETWLHFWPNPNAGDFQIRSDFLLDGIEIFNANGQLVYKRSAQSNTISIRNLNAGFYIIRAFSGNHATSQKLLVAP